MLLKSSASQARESIHTQSVTQACQVKLDAEENKCKLRICSYLKNINSIFFLSTCNLSERMTQNSSYKYPDNHKTIEYKNELQNRRNNFQDYFESKLSMNKFY